MGTRSQWSLVWRTCGVVTLSCMAMSCGDAAGVDGGGGGYFGLGAPSQGVAHSGIFADGVVTDQEYEQYIEAVEAQVAEREFVPSPWASTLTGEETADVEVREDTLTFPPEPVSAGDPGYDPANPSAQAPPKYRINAILVSANYAQDKVFLRRITGVTQGVQGTTYTTRDAAITEAVFQGTITQSPTELDPSFYQGNITTQQMLEHTFSIGDLNVGSGVMYGIGVSSSGGNAGADLTFNVSQPRLEGLSVPVKLDASIKADWLGRIFDRSSTVSGNGVTTRTSCGAVTEALNFTNGNDADSRQCKRALQMWLDSPNYPAIPSSVRSLDGITTRRAGGAERIACNDSINYWPDGTVLLPLPHENDWAQQSCGGVLESFDLETGFDPALVVDNISIRAEASASATRDTELMCERCQVSKSKTFFIGWFPVVLKLKGELIGKAYDVGVNGTFEAGIRDIRLGVETDLELHYNSANGPVSSRSSWRMVSSVEPVVEGEWYAEGTARGHAEHQIAGLRTSLYFYDLAGPYFIPADAYGRADAQIASPSAAVAGETCNFGLTAGFRVKAGLAGKIPLTNSEPVAWELFSYDSCGEDLASNPEETRLSKSFLERDSSLCMKKCLSVTPLTMALRWDQNQDIDLKVTDPEGRVIGRNNNNHDDSVVHFSNARGCQSMLPGNCFGEGGTGNLEYVSWLTDEVPSGTYTVEVKSYSNETVSFDLEFKGDAPTGEPVVNETQRGSVAPNATRTFRFIHTR